jgi:cell division septal protein FtsQ
LATKRSPYPQRNKSNCRTVAKSDSRSWALTLHDLAVLCLGRVVLRVGSTLCGAIRSQHDHK